MGNAEALFPGFAPDPDHPGWLVQRATDGGDFLDFLGELHLRTEGDRHARIRLRPRRRHANILGFVHGGFLLAMIDQSYFLAPHALGIERALGGLTLDSATQFLAPTRMDAPIDFVVEVLRETGRMIFLRGLIEQEGTATVAYSGTIRKASAGR